MKEKAIICQKCQMLMDSVEVIGTNKDGSLNEEYCIYCFKNGEFIEFCQSCGMPLETPEVLGTNKDESPNKEYCIHCFKNGEYTLNATMEEMIEVSLKHMKEIFKDDPSFNEKNVLQYMNTFFPQLKRWNENM